MVGKRHIDVYSKSIEYHLEIERNISVIRGNGSTGKSTLVGLLSQWLKSKSYPVKVSSDCNICVLNEESDYDKLFDDCSNTVFFVDEGVSYICTNNFITSFYSSGCYLVVIDRSGFFDKIDFAIGAIYEFRSAKLNNKLYSTRMYKMYNDSELKLRPNLFVTEDRKSCSLMLKTLVPEGIVETANGKDNIVKRILQYKDKYALSVYYIVDGAMFGSNIASCVLALGDRTKSVIFAPESFEYMCLLCKPFIRKYKDQLTNTSEYADSEMFISWERYFTYLLTSALKEYGITYNKGRLPSSFRSEAFKREFRGVLKDIDWRYFGC